MSSLLPFLQTAIAQAGPMTFHQFMAHALYHPTDGYYASGTARVGRSGDFFTSVSVGPLFGTLLARQFIEIWQRQNCPREFDLVEQGAHHGEFALDVLRALSRLAPECLAATRLKLIEPFPLQRAHQITTLAEFSQVSWFDELTQVGPIRGVVFANELLDAFPVHRVVWDGAQWQESYVNSSGGQLRFESGPLSTPALGAALGRFPVELPSGYTTEINLEAREWSRQVAKQLEQGFLLTIDYGYPHSEYYRPERERGTLTAYHQHQRSQDVLANPGKMDLTAHVDFSAVAENAEAGGLHLHGFCDQHHFMVGLSRLHFEDLPSPELQRDLPAFKTLMHPALMGTSFKVLALETDPSSLLSGFSFSKNPRTALDLD